MGAGVGATGVVVVCSGSSFFTAGISIGAGTITGAAFDCPNAGAGPNSSAQASADSSTGSTGNTDNRNIEVIAGDRASAAAEPSKPGCPYGDPLGHQ